MPFSLEYQSTDGVLIGTCTGTLHLSDALEGARAMWRHPQGSGPVLWDFRSARLSVQPRDVREFAQFVLDHQAPTPPSKVALVTARDSDYGLTRMYEVFREHPATEVRAFRDYQAALDWARTPREDVPER